MKKVFLDMYLAHNLGDDLFLDIIAKRYPNCRFTINYYDKDYNYFIKNYKNIRTRITLKNRLLRKMKIKDYIHDINNIAEYNDVLVFLSGSYFMEHSYSNKEHDRRSLLINEFKSKGKPIYILGTNFGPYDSIDFFNKCKEIFKKCDDVCFRDNYSYNLFKEINVVRKANDVVLGLDVNKYKKNKKEKIVGFSIIDVSQKVDIQQYNDLYIKSIVKSINMFIKKGYKCVLMSFCELEGDLKAINKIIENIGNKNNIEIYKYKDNIEEAINLISTFEIFVASRFHANILGILLNTCIIPLIYSNKTINVLNDLKLGDIAIKMEDIDLIYNEEYINKRLIQKNELDAEISKFNLQFQKLDKVLK